MLQHIVVPMDGSPFGEHALPVALTLARKSGATVHLVHVMPTLAALIGGAPHYLDADLEHRMRTHERAVHRSYLEQLCQRIRRHVTVPLETALLEGEVASVVAEYAAKVSADLVVATTHGRGAIARFWLGSVSDELVQALHAPLLLVHPGTEPTDLATEARLERFVVALDGTPLSEKILPTVTNLARIAGATVRLVRSVKPVFVASYPSLEAAAITVEVEALTAQLHEVQQQIEQDASKYLEKHAAELRKQGLTVQTRVDVAETPASALIDEGKTADIVAIETHARGGWTRFLMGSIADQVVRDSQASVLLHHPVA